eukprot:m.61783 g.61783  ORF g.61783 m.61783 type:complete len:499 (-) comp23031_c0_seq1:124-1620(-)
MAAQPLIRCGIPLAISHMFRSPCRYLTNHATQATLEAQGYRNSMRTSKRSRTVSASDQRRSLLPDLQARGLIADVTSPEETLAEALKSNTKPLTAYCGFDPTAKSLHVGNLAAIMVLVRLMHHGHRALFVVGGATGRIGDPSGRSSERTMLNQHDLDENLEGIKANIAQVCQNAAVLLGYDENETSEFTQRHQVLDNYTWYANQNVVEFLSEVGPHFRVNNMLAKTSIKNRLESDTGLSFLEFSYQVLQAYDFYRLFKEQNCKLQVGGSDQWGNITAGCELIRKMSGDSAFGLTIPLVTTSAGVKFGKSLGNAVWLTKSMTSSYDLYQFFFNTDDRDVASYLHMFSFLEPSDISGIMLQHNQDSALRVAQKRLAEELVKLVHGNIGLIEAQAASKSLFGSQDLSTLCKAEFEAMVRNAPSVDVKFSEMDQRSIAEIVFQAGLFKSKKEAKRSLTAGGIYLNNKKCEQQVITKEDVLLHKYSVVRKGKKTQLVINWTSD